MYRKIVTDFWSDSKVEGLSPSATLLLLYLLTAPSGTLAGCFEITPRRMARDTKLGEGETADALSELVASGILEYDAKTGEVLVRNWSRYNWTKSKSLMKPIAKDIEAVKNPNFRSQLIANFESFFDTQCQHGGDTVSGQSRHVSVSVSVTDRDNVTGKYEPGNGPQVEARHRHGEFSNVLLTDSELAKLKERFPDDWQSRIDDLSYYIGSTGKAYKSHYRTLLSWDRRDGRKARPNASYAKYD